MFESFDDIFPHLHRRHHFNKGFAFSLIFIFSPTIKDNYSQVSAKNPLMIIFDIRGQKSFKINNSKEIG